MKNVWPLAGSLAYASLFGMPAQAADVFTQPVAPSCAVSGPNGKIEGAGGHIDAENNADDGERYHVAGSYSVPLNCEWGFQLDGAAGHVGDNSFAGIGAHLFTRDPDSHLFGIYSEFSNSGNNDYTRVALEGELYRDQFTLTGLAGIENSDVFDDQFFGIAQLSWYATDNFKLNVGVASYLDITAATFGGEWQPDGSSFSLFAEGSVGDDDHSSIYGGVRFYFGGEQKSLIRRHREDDPINWIPVLQRIANTALCPPGEVFDPMEGPSGACVPAIMMDSMMVE